MNVLISGGSGLVGSKLTQLLLKEGHEVRWLSRSSGIKQGVQSYKWDYKKNWIDHNAFNGVTHIVHLAGAGVFDHKWNASYKKEIIDSRTKATDFLVKASSTYPAIKTWVCASAIGIYGNTMDPNTKNEESPLGDDFLAAVTKKWELSTSQVLNLNVRLVQIRIGIVLANEGGALPSMLSPIKYNIGSQLASGQQIISWIHIDDLCQILFESLKTETMNGVYNGVAPKPVSNNSFTRTAAEILGKPLFMPPVPSFVLKVVLGYERAQSIIQGITASSQKIQLEGFKFKFPVIKQALYDLLKT